MSNNFCVWLTGLPSSGKTTIAKFLKEKLKEFSIKSYILDSDELRKILTPNPKYTEEERDWFYDVLVYFAHVLVENGVNVIIAATGNKRRFRKKCREMIKNFIEVYIKCSLEECMRRDSKGLYKMALEGKIKNFPGIQDPYEEPENPELVIDSGKLKPWECAELIIEKIKEFKLLSSN
ncbi:MAG: adenylyl-sulfate kinase [Thermoproteota archaeon]|jgi:adenylylsulfate kinase (apsK)